MAAPAATRALVALSMLAAVFVVNEIQPGKLSRPLNRFSSTSTTGPGTATTAARQMSHLAGSSRTSSGSHSSLLRRGVHHPAASFDSFGSGKPNQKRYGGGVGVRKWKSERSRRTAVGSSGNRGDDPKIALINEMKETSNDDELFKLVESSVMQIDTNFWLKINALKKTAANQHEVNKLDNVATKVWNRLEELNKETESDDASGLDEYYSVLGSPDEEIQELSADEILEKRTKKWINEQLSEMWRNYRTFEKHHIGNWRGRWEVYSDLLGGDRVTVPDQGSLLLTNISGLCELVEDLEGVTVCRHTQNIEALEGNRIYPEALLDKGLDFWPNSPKTWLVANVFSTGDRVEDDNGDDVLLMETALRCDSLRMRILTKYQKLQLDDGLPESMILADIAVGRETLNEDEAEGGGEAIDDSALYEGNNIIESNPGMLCEGSDSSNVTLATRGNLIVQAPRIIRGGEEHYVQVSWKAPPSKSISEELKDVYGEAYSEQAAERGLIITTKRVFSKLNGAADYISLKEELPEDFKQTF